jgi:NarL family two-component system response regulator LiaR
LTPAAPHGDPGLTPREREVLALVARGLANKRIAQELGIAEKTVKIHVSRILHKLGVADRTQAALYAVREGLA